MDWASGYVQYRLYRLYSFYHFPLCSELNKQKRSRYTVLSLLLFWKFYGSVSSMETKLSAWENLLIYIYD